MSHAEENNSVTTRLLTLLNVSALSTRKRKREEEPKTVGPPVKKLNAKKKQHEDPIVREETTLPNEGMDVDKEEAVDETKEPESNDDPYNVHYGADTKLLSEESRTAVDARNWTTSKKRLGSLGEVAIQVPNGANGEEWKAGLHLLDKLRATWEEQQVTTPGDAKLRRDFMTAISTYRDLFLTKQDLSARQIHREVAALHILNHIMKIRRRILKNNEKLANQPKGRSSAEAEEAQYLDQSFTRPSILILLPFRSSAHAWVTALLKAAPSHQVENKSRFLSDFGLPAGAEDKLLNAPVGTYPDDHVANMAGNIDDHFRIGVKVTRKTIKMYSDFYSSDVILASPLGLRELIEKEKSADYLSSIEVLVVDQLDCLTMQNWSHLQLVFKYLNAIPKESHDTDFSRIKPWYLDGHAIYLRQSILFTAYETPEIRALWNRELKNLAGRQKTEVAWAPVQVPDGIRYEFRKFECGNAQNEIDKRFDFFTTNIFPALLKSAVQSVNTVIFIPSYFDYSRIQRWLKDQATVSLAVLSEDSDNKEISRARQAFFAGNKAVLLITERFHFFRRYKIRGIRNVVFYAPPDHPQFYSEFLSYPFLDDNVLAEDVTVKIIYSKYDYMRLERVVGSAEVGKLMVQ